MEHLPTPAGRFRPHPEIEYLCHTEFKIQLSDRFETYPEKYGFDPDVLMRTMDFKPLDFWKAAAVMQEWLFFVLLADVFCLLNIEFEMQDFVEVGRQRYNGEPPRKIVTTRCLRRYLQAWYDVESNQTPNQDLSILEQKRTRRSNVLTLLQQSQTAVLNLLQSNNEYVSPGPFMFWIVCIQETMNNAATVIYGPTFSEEELYGMFSRRTIVHWPPRRMIDNGACPNHVQRLQSLLSTTGIYFASSLYLPEGAISFDHSNCEGHRCKVNYLDRDLYEPKHNCVGGKCSFIGPDKAKILQLLEAGQIPILALRVSVADSVEEVVLDVLSCEQMPYTAISHVWSDGRGNLKGNTLPLCQMKYLYNILQPLTPANETAYFWMDTLCVPVEQQLRRAAIGLMRKTYQDAAQVLVLDSSLELATSEADPNEILIRVQTAGWMRRLWTLQEGALAQKLLVRFRETAVNLHSIGEMIQNSNDRHLRSWLTEDALSCVYSFQPFRFMRSENLLDLARALQWRDTSWKKDETVCLSILLDLDVKQIESTPEEERMGKFLLMVCRLPFELAFLDGPRIAQKPFRWAPSSLMPARGFNLPPSIDSILAIQSTHGLIVELEALSLDRMPTLDLSWVCIGEEGLRYVLKNDSHEKDEGTSWTAMKLDTDINPAILLRGTLSWDVQVDVGILVDVKVEGSRLSTCDYISRVTISGLPAGRRETIWDMIDNPSTIEQASAISAADIGKADRIDKRHWLIH